MCLPFLFVYCRNIWQFEVAFWKSLLKQSVLSHPSVLENIKGVSRIGICLENLLKIFEFLEDFQIFRLLKMIHIPYCSIVNKFSVLLMSGDKILPSHLSNEE